MIKNHVIYLFALKSYKDLEKHDKEIQSFINTLISEEHIFISINTVSLGLAGKSGENLRTQITYKENYTRRVLLEKNKNEAQASNNN